LENVFDNIDDDEYEYSINDKQTGDYCIGLTYNSYNDNNNRSLSRSPCVILSSISSESFLKYNFITLLLYLINNLFYIINIDALLELYISRNRRYNSDFVVTVKDTLSLFSNYKVNIIEVYIDPRDSTYNAIIKTIWLKLIQRKWKKIFEERKQILMNRTKVSSILYKQIKGRYPDGMNSLPTLHGMLYSLRKSQ